MPMCQLFFFVDGRNRATTGRLCSNAQARYRIFRAHTNTDSTFSSPFRCFTASLDLLWRSLPREAHGSAADRSVLSTRNDRPARVQVHKAT